jgi:DNA polymerase III sliding clamp (beta) subunit (PCNA family)
VSDKNSISREALARAASLVRPALSSQNYIPSLTHVRFQDGWATAYNDITAIGVKSPLEELDACLPGELMIKALSGFGASEVAIQENRKEASVVISSGRSKLKLHTLPSKDFPFEWPEGDSVEVELNEEILKGIERCLISVGSDPTHPAQMGVTLESDDAGQALLFSTDNFTISRFHAKSKGSKIKLPGGSPVILPTFFCEQLVLLSKTFADDDVTLHLFPGAIMAVIGDKAQLFTKSPVDLEPIDFSKMVSKYFKVDSVVKMHQRIPDGFEAALGRALLVLSSSADKVTKFEVTDSYVKLSTSSDLGDSKDSLKFECDEGSEDPFHVDPSLVSRASKVCSNVTFLDRVLLLSNDDASFVHMISHCSA